MLASVPRENAVDIYRKKAYGVVDRAFITRFGGVNSFNNLQTPGNFILCVLQRRKSAKVSDFTTYAGSWFYFNLWYA